MKIVYILLTSSGGIPHYTAELANAVANYADVVVVKPKDFNDNLFSEKVKLMNVFSLIQYSRSKPLASFRLRNIKGFLTYNNIKIILQIDPDIIHFPAHYPQSFFAYLHGLDKKYPTACTLHAVYKSPIISPMQTGTKSYLNAIMYTLVEIIAKKMNYDKIIVQTKGNWESLISMGVDPGKIAIIPHGAYTFFRQYEEYPADIEEQNCILFFGYILESKGIDVLIKAMHLIVKGIPDIKLIIAGEGDLSTCMPNMDSLRSNLEVYNYFIPNELVSKLFARSKFLVAPYTYEPGPSGVISAAFAFGKPVITTNVGDLPNIVENGREGLIIPSNDPKALADAIINLLEDKACMKRMGENAYLKAQKLSWDNIAKLHIEIYKHAIEDRKRSIK